MTVGREVGVSVDVGRKVDVGGRVEVGLRVGVTLGAGVWVGCSGVLVGAEVLVSMRAVVSETVPVLARVAAGLAPLHPVRNRNNPAASNKIGKVGRIFMGHAKRYCDTTKKRRVNLLIPTPNPLNNTLPKKLAYNTTHRFSYF